MKKKILSLLLVLGLFLAFDAGGVLAAGSTSKGPNSKISSEPTSGNVYYYDSFQEGWSAATEAANNADDPVKVTLLADWTADLAANIGTSFGTGTGFNNGYLTVDTGKYIDFYLNGYTLNRNLQSSQAYSGYVIYNSGHLTISDINPYLSGDSKPGGTGTITGGFSDYGGGIRQSSDGTLPSTVLGRAVVVP